MHDVFGEGNAQMPAILTYAGAALESCAQIDAALRFHKMALHLGRKTLGNEHLDIIKSLEAIARINDKSAYDRIAKKYYIKAYNLSKRTLGQYHPRTINLASLIAGKLIKATEFRAAKFRYEMILDASIQIKDYNNALKALDELILIYEKLNMHHEIASLKN